jgi:hypothetical protein
MTGISFCAVKNGRDSDICRAAHLPKAVTQNQFRQGRGGLADTGKAVQLRSSTDKELTMANRYGKKAQIEVKRAMHERKRGTLRSGRSGKRVTSRKQAIAIGLSQARRAGGKVPTPPGSRRSRSRKK